MTPQRASSRKEPPRWRRRVLAAALIAGSSICSQAQPLSSTLRSALAEQRRLVAADPGRSKLWNDLGNLLLLQSKDQDAQTAYRMAVAVGPENARARYNLALLSLQRNDREAAMAQLQSVLEIDPLHARTHYQIGALHEADGSTEAAVTAYALAFQLDPDLVFPRVNPDVIENRLVLQALFRRDKSRLRGTTLPTVYDDAERILRLLLSDLEPQADPE